MKTLMMRMLYTLRDVRSRRLFSELALYSRGSVLDVGGWDFYQAAIKKNIPFECWTVLEPGERANVDVADDRIHVERGDGCSMKFGDAMFDTVLNVQVLEHVFEPNHMMREMCRVLKPGGHLIMLIPQTSTLHMIPNHYYNFTRFWVAEALRQNDMDELKLTPLGGVWSSMASHLVYFMLQSLRYDSMSAADFIRPPLFYVLYPFMVLFAVIAFPVCMAFTLGDLTEEPNNHLVVARKPHKPRTALL